MVSPVKPPASMNGHKVGDIIYLMCDGVVAQVPSIIRRIGLAGFFVRGSNVGYYWHEEGRTWCTGLTTVT